MRFFLRILPILFVVAIVLTFHLIGVFEYRKFYKSRSNSIVISKEKGSSSAVMKYSLNDGLTIESLNIEDIDIEVGDSIVKDSNTFIFSFFKKNGEAYSFDGKYKYLRGVYKGIQKLQ